MLLSEYFRELREVNHLSLRQTAAKMGVSPRQVGRWETGEALPSPVQQKQLAALYRIDVRDLMNPNRPAVLRPRWAYPDDDLLVQAREGRAEIARHEGFERPIGGTL